MMLYEEAMEDAIKIDVTSTSDGMGGFIPQYSDGAPFKAAFGKNTTLQAIIAEKQGVTEVYTITTYASSRLHYHDIVKRVKDGMIFRVTSNVDDNETPKVASFSMAQVSAEVWKLVQ